MSCHADRWADWAFSSLYECCNLNTEVSMHRENNTDSNHSKFRRKINLATGFETMPFSIGLQVWILCSLYLIIQFQTKIKFAIPSAGPPLIKTSKAVTNRNSESAKGGAVTSRSRSYSSYFLDVKKVNIVSLAFL